MAHDNESIDLAYESLGNSGVGRITSLPTKGVKIVDIGGNLLTETCAHELANWIRGLKNLEDMDLRDNSLHGDGLGEVVDALMALGRLGKLRLDTNSIRDHGARVCAHMVRYKVNRPGWFGSSWGRVTGITELELCDNAIGPDGAAALGQALGMNQCSLARLSLAYNPIATAGAVQFFQAAAGNRSLTDLDLSDCGIEDLAAESIRRAISGGASGLSGLRELNICVNEFSHAGAAVIAEGLRENKSLATFDIGRNDIGDEGGTPIFDSLQHHPRLTNLKVPACLLGGGCADSLLSLMEANSNILDLDVEQNLEFPDDTAEKIRLAVLESRKKASAAGESGREAGESKEGASWGMFIYLLSVFLTIALAFYLT